MHHLLCFVEELGKSKVALAISGGSDSMALAALARKVSEKIESED